MRTRTANALLAASMVLLCAAAASAGEDSSIKLPPSFGALQDVVDVTAPFTINPTNPDLVQGPDYQPLGLTLQSELVSPELLRAAAGFDFSCYRLVLRQEDFADPQSPNLYALADIVERITRAGVEVMLTLDSSGLNLDSYMEAFARIDGEVGGLVRYYQLLDNLNHHLGVSSGTYHELVKRVRAYREETGRPFEIVAGGIRGIDHAFIDELAGAYVFARVDAIAFNLYPDAEHMEYSPARAEAATHSLREVVEAFAALRRYGKPVFVTALGVSNAYAPLGVSQLEQASMTARAILFLLNGGASRVILHSLSDTDPSYFQPLQCMGLYAWDGSSKPVANVVRNLAPLLRGSFFFYPYYDHSMQNNFPAGSDPVYVHHLYHPPDRVTYYIYWTSTMNMIDRSTNLVLYRPGLQPVSVHNLLTGENSPAQFNRGGNLILFAGLPLSHVPTAIKMIGEQPNG